MCLSEIFCVDIGLTFIRVTCNSASPTPQGKIDYNSKELKVDKYENF
jgi:hypothetical protein